jgi:hypothetical protein
MHQICVQRERGRERATEREAGLGLTIRKGMRREDARSLFQQPRRPPRSPAKDATPPNSSSSWDAEEVAPSSSRAALLLYDLRPVRPWPASGHPPRGSLPVRAFHQIPASRVERCICSMKTKTTPPRRVLLLGTRRSLLPFEPPPMRYTTWTPRAPRSIRIRGQTGG